MIATQALDGRGDPGGDACLVEALAARDLESHRRLAVEQCRLAALDDGIAHFSDLVEADGARTVVCDLKLFIHV